MSKDRYFKKDLRKCLSTSGLDVGFQIDPILICSINSLSNVITCMGAAHTGGYVCGRIKSGAIIGETLYAANMHSSNLVEISVLPHMMQVPIVMVFMCTINMF